MQATPHPVDRSIACTPASRITDRDPESRSNARAAVSATEESSSTDGTFLRMPDASEENVNVSLNPSFIIIFSFLSVKMTVC